MKEEKLDGNGGRRVKSSEISFDMFCLCRYVAMFVASRFPKLLVLQALPWCGMMDLALWAEQCKKAGLPTVH